MGAVQNECSGMDEPLDMSDFLLSTFARSFIFQRKGSFEAMPLFRCTYIQYADEVHPVFFSPVIFFVMTPDPEPPYRDTRTPMLMK
eukprot:COSAG03_NODE_12627_length_538_cov_1.157175_1_plen_85_part_01